MPSQFLQGSHNIAVNWNMGARPPWVCAPGRFPCNPEHLEDWPRGRGLGRILALVFAQNPCLVTRLGGQHRDTHFLHSGRIRQCAGAASGGAVEHYMRSCRNMHCYGDSRLIRHEENREPGLADKLRCTGILARSGMLAAELDTVLRDVPGVIHGGHSRDLAVVSIGGNDIEQCETTECLRRAEGSIGRVVARLSREYKRVALMGPPGNYRHSTLPFSSGDITGRLQGIVAPYTNAVVLRLDHVPVRHTSDNLHFDDTTNTRVAATILAGTAASSGADNE